MQSKVLKLKKEENKKEVVFFFFALILAAAVNIAGLNMYGADWFAKSLLGF